MKSPLGLLLPVMMLAASAATAQAESVARTWNEQILDAIRIDFPAPTVHARNLFHTSVAMWDAWAAYDTEALGYLHRESASATDIPAARDEAISYAAYGVLSVRYLLSTNAETTFDALRDQMFELGYDPDFTGIKGESPAALGNRIAATALAYYADDGSNEDGKYTDNSYSPKNAPLILARAGTTMLAPNRWQPLAFDIAQTQNGQVADKVQIFVGAHWGQVRPFAMWLRPGETLYHDPGPPPLLGSDTEASFKEANLLVLRRSRDLDPDRPAMIDISPKSSGNNTLGTNDGSGYLKNPATGQEYVANVVPLGDYGRVLAEFWADGLASETPPGHWNTLANSVADSPDFVPRLGGTCPVLPQLEWDVKLYFALNGALHDAAVAAWGCKRAYDYVRPISSIRHMAVQGTLPLEPDLVELVTTASSFPGGRHSRLRPGALAVNAWLGEPDDPELEHSGVGWILAENWLPYQRDTFVTPAFAGYVSGHSCFSRAAAEILTLMTGDPFFPGGMGTFTASANEDPRVRTRPKCRRDPTVGDLLRRRRRGGGLAPLRRDPCSRRRRPGRIIGSKCGIAAYQLASKYFDGSVLSESISMDLQPSIDGQYQLS